MIRSPLFLCFCEIFLIGNNIKIIVFLNIVFLQITEVLKCLNMKRWTKISLSRARQP